MNYSSEQKTDSRINCIASLYHMDWRMFLPFVHPLQFIRLLVSCLFISVPLWCKVRFNVSHAADWVWISSMIGFFLFFSMSQIKRDCIAENQSSNSVPNLPVLSTKFPPPRSKGVCTVDSSYSVGRVYKKLSAYKCISVRVDQWGHRVSP